MVHPLADNSFTPDDEDRIAYMWAGLVRKFIKFLGQCCAKDPNNQKKHHWSEQKLQDVQKLHTSVAFHRRLCHYLNERNSPQKDEFIMETPEKNAQARVSSIPTAVLDDYTKQNFPERSSSPSKRRRIPSANRGKKGQKTSTNAKNAGEPVKKNLYPSHEQTPSADPSASQPNSLMTNTAVVGSGYPNTTSGVTDGSPYSAWHSSASAGNSHHNAYPSSSDPPARRLRAPKANPRKPDKHLTRTWAATDGWRTPPMTNDTHNPSPFAAAATRCSSGYNVDQQHTSLHSSDIVQSSAVDDLNETSLGGGGVEPFPPPSYPVAGDLAGSVKSTDAAVPTLDINSFQPTHISSTNMSHGLGQTSYPPYFTGGGNSAILEVPRQPPGPGHNETFEDVGTSDWQQQAPSSLYSAMYNHVPTNLTPPPLTSNTFATNSWDVGTLLAPMGTPNHLGIYNSTGWPLAVSGVTSEDNQATAPMHLLEKRVLDPSGVEIPLPVSPIENNQRPISWKYNPEQSFIGFVPVGTGEPTSNDDASTQTTCEFTSQGGSPIGIGVDWHTSGGRVEVDHPRPALDQTRRSSSPGLNQMGKRAHEETVVENSDPALRRSRAAFPPVNKKRRT